MKRVTTCWTDRALMTLPSIYSPLALSFSELDKVTEIFSGINPQDHSNEKRCNAFTNPVGTRAELAASPSRAPYDISIFLGTRCSHTSKSVPVNRFIRRRPHRGRGHKQIYINFLPSLGSLGYFDHLKGLFSQFIIFRHSVLVREPDVSTSLPKGHITRHMVKSSQVAGDKQL